MSTPEPRFEDNVIQQAAAHLRALGAANPAIALALVTSEDGFEIASYRGTDVSRRIAAMTSSLQALSEAMCREARLGSGNSLIIEAELGTIIVLGIASTSPRLSLALVAKAGETLGTLLWVARSCSKSLEASLRK
jgi:predicted regulator of Ras-like GTPase activity (Roadblock/LC7/MglB family)